MMREAEDPGLPLDLDEEAPDEEAPEAPPPRAGPTTG